MAYRAMIQLGSPVSDAFLAKLIKAHGDRDSDLRQLAEKSFESLRPFDASHADVFRSHLRDTNQTVRLVAARELFKTLDSTDEVLSVYQPMITDASPEVRAIAVLAIAKFPTIKQHLDRHYYQLLHDKSPLVRAACLIAVSDIKLDSSLKSRLLRIAEDDPEQDLREKALAVIANSVEATPDDLSLIHTLLKSDQPISQVKSLKLLSQLKDKGSTHWFEALEHVKSSHLEVQVAAIQLLPHTDQHAVKYVPYIYDLLPESWNQFELRNTPGDQVKVHDLHLSILYALAAIQPEGLDVLLKYTKQRTLPVDARNAICRGLLVDPKLSYRAIPQIMLWVDEYHNPSHEMAKVIASYPTDENIQMLIARTDLKKIGRGPGAQDVVPSHIRAWAIFTLGSFDLEKLTEKQKKLVLDHIRHLRTAETDPNNKELALKMMIRYGGSLNR